MNNDKRRKKLRITELDEVSHVDAGMNQEAHVRLLKRDDKMKKAVLETDARGEPIRGGPDAADRELDAALKELRDLVDAAITANPAPGVVYHVVMSRVLARNPKLHARLEAAASAVGIYKADGGTESEIQKRAAKLMATDPKLTPALARAAVWKASPELRQKSYSAYANGEADASRPHDLPAAKATHVTKRALDAAVSELCELVAPGDVYLGRKMVAERFPSLWAAHQRA